MLFDSSIDDGKPEPCPLVLRLGGEKRIKDLCLNAFSNARAGILNTNIHKVILYERPDPDSSGVLINGINGIVDETEIVGYCLQHRMKEAVWVILIFLKNGNIIEWHFRSQDEREKSLQVIDTAIGKNRKVIIVPKEYESKIQLV